jgi:hypothetical protein
LATVIAAIDHGDTSFYQAAPCIRG